jgi:hypothetical protein
MIQEFRRGFSRGGGTVRNGVSTCIVLLLAAISLA